MRHIGLFAGIGGFELAARWMGWNTIAWSEWDPFCQKVLSYHFPEAKGYGDIKQSDFTQYRGQCDILTGGFPCQPYSVAGKRLGKEDERHLWPEMLRVIREVQPRWIIGENVRGLLSWNEGVVFEEVCTDLESEGYKVQAFIIPAASVGAPHRRERVWIVANARSSRLERRSIERVQTNEGRTFTIQSGVSPRLDQQTNWENFPTISPVCGGDDGLPSELDGITLPKWRKESIKAYGNAIVPQVAYQLFQAIKNTKSLDY